MTHNGLIYQSLPDEEGTKTLNAIEFMIEDSKNWSGGSDEPSLMSFVVVGMKI